VQRRRHLLAASQGDETHATRVVVEREPPLLGVDLRPLHGAIQRYAVAGERRELENLPETEINLHLFTRCAS